jgi:hypothetical protein
MKTELKFSISKIEYIKIKEILDQFDYKVCLDDMCSYYFGDLDSLFDGVCVNKRFGVLKIRKESKGYFLYFKEFLKQGHSILSPTSNRNKVEIETNVAKDCIENGLDLKLLVETNVINNNSIDGIINFIGLIEIKRVSYRYDENIIIVLDKYWCEDKEFNVLEIQFEQEIIEDKIKICNLLKNLNVSKIKYFSKKDELFYEIYKRKLLEHILSMTKAEAIVLCNLSIDRSFDFEKFIAYVFVNEDGRTENHKFMNRCLEIEIVDFENLIDSYDYKRLYYLLVGDCIFGNEITDKIRNKIRLKNTYLGVNVINTSIQQKIIDNEIDFYNHLLGSLK